MTTALKIETEDLPTILVYNRAGDTVTQGMYDAMEAELEGYRLAIQVSLRSGSLREAVAQTECVAIRAALAKGGSRPAAAKLLGISLRTLFYKLRRLNLNEPTFATVARNDENNPGSA